MSWVSNEAFFGISSSFGNWLLQMSNPTNATLPGSAREIAISHTLFFVKMDSESLVLKRKREYPVPVAISAIRASIGKAVSMAGWIR